jgi:hypothetical protein
MLTPAIVVTWYARHGHDPADTGNRREDQPWYADKTEPTFKDMPARLRRVLTAARISGDSAAQPSPPPSKSAPSPQPGPQQPHKYESRAKGDVGINLLPHAVRELTELGLGNPLEDTGIATSEQAHFDRFGSLIWSEPSGTPTGPRHCRT